MAQLESFVKIPEVGQTVMIVEWLKFRVSPGTTEAFIAKDAEIWTTALAQYPGFLGKEVWISPQTPEEILLIVRWETRGQWKSIPQAALDRTERQFLQAMDTAYELIAVGEYEVRKNGDLG